LRGQLPTHWPANCSVGQVLRHALTMLTMLTVLTQNPL
jgi:hypothetical protein